MTYVLYLDGTDQQLATVYVGAPIPMTIGQEVVAYEAGAKDQGRFLIKRIVWFLSYLDQCRMYVSRIAESASWTDQPRDATNLYTDIVSLGERIDALFLGDHPDEDRIADELEKLVAEREAKRVEFLKAVENERAGMGAK